jgi:hypothetical protein
MARKLPVEYSGAIYHVMNRSDSWRADLPRRPGRQRDSNHEAATGNNMAIPLADMFSPKRLRRRIKMDEAVKAKWKNCFGSR